MKKILKSAITSAVVWVLNRRLQQSIELARIEAARKIISGAEEVREWTRLAVLVMIMCAMIGAGAVMLIIGVSLFVVWKAMYSVNPSLYDLLAWIPLGICIGGLLSLIPPFVFIFFQLLSEKNWMNALKKNKIFGGLICEVLEDARLRSEKR